MNLLFSGISAGRWFGIKVTITWIFLIYALSELSDSWKDGILAVEIHILELTLLFGTVLVHEFGHALSCRAVGGEANHILLWPLGGISFVKPPMNPRAWLITTICGPLVNAILWPIFWYLSAYHFGIDDENAFRAFMSTHSGIQFALGTACYLMWWINRMLLLFNLIPAYPMDGGRILQELLWFALGLRRSFEIAGMVGVVAGACFVALGLGAPKITIPYIDFSLGGGTNWNLVAIGALCAMQSWGIYQRAKASQSQQNI
jgi:Zn-dependent protease